MSSGTVTSSELIKKLGSPDAETRKHAAYQLEDTRSKRAVRALIRALDDPDRDVRSAAASVLNTRHPEAIEAVPKLIESLNDPDWTVRFDAVALGEIGDARAVEPLIGRLRAGDDEFHSVARALAATKDRRALDPLVAELRRTDDAYDRGALWRCLGKLGCAAEVHHLSHLLHTPGWELRAEERRVLVEPPAKRTRRLPVAQIEMIRADIEEFARADEDATWRAVRRLGRRRGLVVEHLAEATASPNPEVRHLALHALERVGDPRAFPVVLEMTRDPVPDTRWCALATLGRLGKERAIPVLVEVLRNLGPNDTHEDFGAREGLEAIGKPAVPALIGLLATGEPHAKSKAAWVLGWMGDEAAIEPLSKLLDEPAPDVRELGVECLGRMAEENVATRCRCLALIEPMQDDPVEAVRKEAGYWCGEIGKAMTAAVEP